MAELSHKIFMGRMRRQGKVEYYDYEQNKLIGFTLTI